MSDNGSASRPDPTQGDPRPGESPPPSARRTVLIVLALAVGFFVLPRAVRSCGTANGKEAPDFAASVVANQPAEWSTPTVKLSDLRGKVVVLDFWATWCGPCQVEMPIVNGIAERFGDRGVVVLGVNTSDTRGLAERFVEGRNFKFPIVYDDDNVIAHKFGVSNIPTLIVVGKDGKIVATRQGITSHADLVRLVERALSS